MLAVNLTGTFLVTRAALLRSPAGVVVNFSSTSASFAHPYMAAYSASLRAVTSTRADGPTRPRSATPPADPKRGR